MLFMILTIWPVPTSPQCMTSEPMVSITGWIRAKVASEAPTMMASVPSAAACRVRAMGASANAILLALAASAISRIKAG